MEATKIKPVYEFVPPKRGDLVWLCRQYTYSEVVPDFTAYYFDFVSAPGNLCYRKISLSEKGHRLAFDFANHKSATEQTHLIIKPADIKYYRLCRTAQEAYAVEMSYHANKIAQLNAAMLREMIPIQPLPVVKPVEPKPVIVPPPPVAPAATATRKPEEHIYLNFKAVRNEIYRLLGMDKLKKPAVTAKQVIESGITRSQLRKVHGVGSVAIDCLSEQMQKHGLKLPD